jgi:hypothetical protein
MLSLTSELEALRERGAVDARRAEMLLRAERREVFSLHYEIRVAAYVAVAMIVGAVGAILKNNLERTGPLTIVLVVAVAAAALLAYAVAQKRRGTFTIFTDYLALLGALLVSADLGYAEQQFDLFGRYGFDHLLVLAAFHAVYAYVLESKLLLSLSLALLAAWFGIDRTMAGAFTQPVDLGRQAFLCAAAIIAWRFVHGRISRKRELDAPFEHFAVNLLGFGVTAYVAEEAVEWLGVLLMIAFVAGVGMTAVRRRSELYLLYTLFHGITAASILVNRHVSVDVLQFLWFVGVFIGAMAALFVAHMRWRFDR